MISICIPVYNTDVNELIKNLVAEIEDHLLTCEIIVIDDGSFQSYKDINKTLSSLPFVSYSELPHNYGRIDIRKRLAACAKYEWILFIDADSEIINKKFISNYVSCCKNENDVVIGGRVYKQEPPLNCNLKLHWKYGRERERSDKRRFIFMTNNFLIRKTIFQQLKFPGELNGYGHEDTWMGIQLKLKDINITFIKNPILHIGLESAERFIEKSRNALKNLIVLEDFIDKEALNHHVKILRYYNILKKFGFAKVFVFIESVFHRNVFENLSSCKASLFFFDFYRLVLFIKLKTEHSSIQK